MYCGTCRLHLHCNREVTKSGRAATLIFFKNLNLGVGKASIRDVTTIKYVLHSTHSGDDINR